MRASWPSFPWQISAASRFLTTSGGLALRTSRAILGYSGFRERSYPTQDEQRTLIEVDVTTLDAALAPDYVATLIKIDVEGAEREVLEGAIGTITKYRPTVIFEHGRGAADRYGTEPRHIYELLCIKAGLRLFDIDGNGPFSFSEMEKIYARGALRNFFARP